MSKKPNINKEEDREEGQKWNEHREFFEVTEWSEWIEQLPTACGCWPFGTSLILTSLLGGAKQQITII